MRRKVILAGSLREANQYCRDKGIRALFASNPSQVKQADHIIQLPGFAKRRDRFGLERARDSRVKYGRDVRFDSELSWEPPAKVVQEVDEELQAAEAQAHIAGIYEIDLNDQTVLEELKLELNKVGLTLRKLPAKKTEAEVPTVDAPVEF